MKGRNKGKQQERDALTVFALMEAAKARGIEALSWEYVFVLSWLTEKHPEILNELREDLKKLHA
jgi:hypothetical protein